MLRYLTIATFSLLNFGSLYAQTIGQTSNSPTNANASINSDSFAFENLSPLAEEVPILPYLKKDVSSYKREFQFWSIGERGLPLSYQPIEINHLPLNQSKLDLGPYQILSLINSLAEVEKTEQTSRLSEPIEALALMPGYRLKPQPLQRQKELRLSGHRSLDFYKNKTQLTLASGRLKGDVAFAFSALRKWSIQGVTPGTYGLEQGLIGSVSKQCGTSSHITFSHLIHHQKLAPPSPIVKELGDLTGNYLYNPSWGWQNGKKRASNERQQILALWLLNYQSQWTKRTNFQLNLAFNKGINRFGGLDWFQADNPLPDDYKNLPSFYYLQGGHSNHLIGDRLSARWQESPFQIDWQRLYEVNTLNGSSVYVSRNDVNNFYRAQLKTHLDYQAGKNLKLRPHLFIQKESGLFYREIADLLGGTHYVNLNQFADLGRQPNEEWQYFNLLDPLQRIFKKDKYYYHYQAESMEAELGLHAKLQLKKVTLSWSNTLTRSQLNRIGYFQNGIFKTNSLGKTKPFSTLTGSSILKANYQIFPYHLLTTKIGWQSNSPTFNQTFIAPRVRNTKVPHLRPETIIFYEIDHFWQFKKGWLQLAQFYSERQHGTEVLNFYHDDYKSYVNYVLNEIGTRQIGLDVYSEIKALPYLSFQILASAMQAYYHTRPQVSIYLENDTASMAKEQVVYWKNRASIEGPQLAGGIGLSFHHKTIGTWALKGTYQTHHWVRMNPVRRSPEAVYLTAQEPDLFSEIVEQEQLPSYFLGHFRWQKTFYFSSSKKSHSPGQQINLQFSMRHLFWKQQFPTRGFESYRFDFDHKNPALFPNKYRFTNGPVYAISLSYKLTPNR